MANAIRIGREKVDSSNLEAIGYDAEKQILAVEFKSGDIFHYAPFTPEQAAEFGAAPSKGSYYSEHIKGKVSGQKMTGPCPNCGDAGWLGEKCTDCGTAVYTEKPYERRETRPEGVSHE